MLNALTYREVIKLTEILAPYSPAIRPLQVTWCFDDSISLQDGILGGYYAATDMIILPPEAKEILFDDVIYIPTLIHELYHAYQKRKLGYFLFSICNVPFLREWTIEPGAEKAEKEARKKLRLEAYETGED